MLKHQCSKSCTCSCLNHAFGQHILIKFLVLPLFLVVRPRFSARKQWATIDTDNDFSAHPHFIILWSPMVTLNSLMHRQPTNRISHLSADWWIFLVLDGRPGLAARKTYHQWISMEIPFLSFLWDLPETFDWDSSDFSWIFIWISWDIPNCCGQPIWGEVKLEDGHGVETHDIDISWILLKGIYSQEFKMRITMNVPLTACAVDAGKWWLGCLLSLGILMDFGRCYQTRGIKAIMIQVCITSLHPTSSMMALSPK